MRIMQSQGKTAKKYTKCGAGSWAPRVLRGEETVGRGPEYYLVGKENSSRRSKVKCSRALAVDVVI